MDILRGNINVEELSVSSPTVLVVENPDGTHNYDPLLKAQTHQPKEVKVPEPAKQGKPTQIDIRKIAFTDATIRQVKRYKTGDQDTIELTHVNVIAEGLKNGQSGKLALDADVKMQNHPPQPGTNSLLQAKVSGNFAFGLTRDLKPASIEGKARLDINQAAGGMADLAALGAELNCVITPTDLKQVALRFEKSNAQLGQVLVSGPFDLEKLEGKLKVQIVSIDKQVLNLAGAGSGIDFGTTMVNSTNELELANGGKRFSLQGQVNVDKLQVIYKGQPIPALDLLARYEITPSEIKQVMLQFENRGTPVGEIRVGGPFSMEKKEGRLGMQIVGIDKQVLNLVGAASGLDFGSTMLNASNEIAISKSGSVVSLKGELKIDKFQLTRNGQTTPALDLTADYDETADLSAQTNLLRTLTLIGQQGGKALLRADLTSPMTLAWGAVTNAVGDSALNLAITHLNLADWRPFIGDSASAGDANLKLTLLAGQAGKKLTFDLDSHIDNLTAGTGTNQITQASVLLQGHGQASDLKQFNLSNYKLQVSRQSEPIVSVSGSATYDTAAKNADAQVNGQLMLARLVQSLSRPDINISSGTADLKAHVTQTTQFPGTKQESSTRNVAGNLVLSDFTGKFGNDELRSFGSKMEVDAGMTPQQVQIRKLSGDLSQGSNAGGRFDLSATYDLTNKSAQFSAKLTEFNQAGLGPFLQPALGDKKLVSIRVNGSASGHYRSDGDSGLKADLQLANLVVSDPKNLFPATPLEAKMLVDASLHKQVADVRQCQLGLTPTPRGKNEVNLTGRLDMSDTNATTGNLKLAADSLDLTSYYDLFAGPKKPNQQQPDTSPSHRSSAPSQAPSDANREPEPMKLPLRNFNAEVAIGRCYLHEVEITNFLTDVKVDGGHVLLNPFKLTLNGAPVSTTADLDLGVPGYKYDLTFNAGAVPLAPLVNTFEPERKGQIGGTVSAQAKINGTGTTGANLKKTLAGQFDVTSTNLNLSIIDIKSRLLTTLVNVIAAIPELARNPAAVVGAAFGKGGLSEELAKAPINTISAHGVAGAGKVELQQSLVQSSAFKAEAAGSVTLADVLTNSSILFPVSVSLGRPVAEKLNLVPANTPTNEAYAKLPDFLTMKGTVGDPKPEINKVALAGTAFKSIGGIVSEFGGKSGGLIKSAGDLLTGTHSSTNAPSSTSTNQPAAGQSPINDILNQFLKPKPRK
jgi:hypothetical protein